jgi:hypothetical protein
MALKGKGRRFLTKPAAFRVSVHDAASGGNPIGLPAARLAP